MITVGINTIVFHNLYGEGIVKKIIDENLVGKRLVDFVKKYCAYYSKDPEFQRLFYNEYPSVAEQLGWNVIKERKTAAFYQYCSYIRLTFGHISQKSPVGILVLS